MKKIKLLLLVGLLFYFIYLLITVDFSSAWNNKIEITNEYIINDHWDEKHNFRIQIDKMIVNDDRLDVFSKDFIQNSNFWDFEQSLSKDSTFTCSFWETGSGNQTHPKFSNKVYFTKNNGWDWTLNGEKTPIIGKLEKDTWYKFSNLTMNTKFYIYVYIDSVGAAHDFSVNQANF
ncbi:MAG: hypothetical protein ABGX00_08735 [Allomuricauda sp.]